MLVIFDSVDGTGKGTQSELLYDYLTKNDGDNATLYSFPRYDETFSGKYIGQFLRGDFGKLSDVHPVLAAALFAVDRIESCRGIAESVDNYPHVIFDRFTVSNYIHQAAKLPEDERDFFKDWLDTFEPALTDTGEDVLTIYLKLDLAGCLELIAKKSGRTYTDKPDIQESDHTYLAEVIKLYDEWAASQDYRTVTVEVRGKDGNIRTPADIHQEIVRLVGIDPDNE